MSTEPDWEEILLLMYDTRQSVYTPATIDPESDAATRLSAEYNLFAQTDHSQSELADIIQFMRETELIWKSGEIDVHDPKGDDGIIDLYDLSSKGFDVAHDIRMRKSQQRKEDERVSAQNDVNRAIGFLTLGLLFINLTNAFLQAVIDLDYPQLAVGSLFLVNVMTVVAIAALVYRSGLLTVKDPSPV